MDLQRACGWNGNIHVQNHGQIRCHHKAIVIAGGQLHNQGIIIHILSAHPKFVPSQRNIRVFVIFPGNIFSPYRSIDISRIQRDSIFRDFQREGLVRILKRHGHVPQREISIIVIVIIQDFYSVSGAGIRLYPAGSGYLKICVSPGRQDRTYQSRRQ